MADVIILPDFAQIVSHYWRNRPEVQDLIDQRVYTVLPSSPTFPLAWLRGPSFGQASSAPRWSARAGFDVWSYGGSRKASELLAETLLGTLDLPDFIGVYTIDDEPVGVVSGVEYGSSNYQPDADYTPAKPCQISTFAVLGHAVVPTGS